MDFRIEYDQYIFHVEVIHYAYQKPLGKWADSDVDCYGYEDLEWQCTAVEETLEDNSVVETTVDIDQYSDQYSDYIESQLLEMIHDAKDDGCDNPTHWGE